MIARRQSEFISGQNRDMITLQRGGTHDENSHSNDKSVYLNHKLIKAVSDAVGIALNASAAVICRNLLSIPMKGCIIGARNCAASNTM